MRGTDLTWAGGEHTFLLDIDRLRALQDKCDAGPAFILHRLSTQRWHVDDIVSTIRLGLEGGGLSKEEAAKLVRKHIEDAPLAEFVMTAQAVLMAALYGAEDDPTGESQAGEAEAASATLSRARKSDGRPSTDGEASGA